MSETRKPRSARATRTALLAPTVALALALTPATAGGHQQRCVELRAMLNDSGKATPGVIRGCSRGIRPGRWVVWGDSRAAYWVGVLDVRHRDCKPNPQSCHSWKVVDYKRLPR